MSVIEQLSIVISVRLEEKGDHLVGIELRSQMQRQLHYEGAVTCTTCANFAVQYT